MQQLKTVWQNISQLKSTYCVITHKCIDSHLSNKTCQKPHNLQFSFNLPLELVTLWSVQFLKWAVKPDYFTEHKHAHRLNVSLHNSLIHLID